MDTTIAIPQRQGTLYRVNYQYSFPSRSTVFIDGIGTVLATGKLSYLTSSDSIQIRDQFEGQPLYGTVIKDFVRLMGSSDDDIPRESDFPESYRQGSWKGTMLFSNIVLLVLDHFFPSGYLAYQKQNRQQFLTAFSDLPNQTKRLRAQVAVLVTLPADAPPNNLAFKLQFKARERRSHSAWRSELEENSKSAVKIFITNVINALERGGVVKR